MRISLQLHSFLNNPFSLSEKNESNNAQVSGSQLSRVFSQDELSLSGSAFAEILQSFASGTVDTETTAEPVENENLTKVRELLNGIRETAESDAGGLLTDEEREAAQTSIDTALKEIGSLTGIDIRPGLATTAELSAVNEEQISSAAVVSLAPNQDISVSGTVQSAATSATLIIEGTETGDVSADSQFELISDQGSAIFSVQEGESLSSVAERINAESSLGITASLSGSELLLATTSVGSDASIEFETIPTKTNGNSKINSAQISSVSIGTISGGSSESLSGTVDSAASRAQLSLNGKSGSLVEGTASFRVIGESGSAVISVTKDESLSDVADRINNTTESTGVIAEVDGDDLLIQSELAGSDQSIQVELLTAEDVSETSSGVNSSQVSNFTINSLTFNTSEVITGTVTQAATAAQLTYEGIGGAKAASTATFELTGALGTTSISVTENEALSDVADRINLESGSTGVSAAVSANDLIFTSTAEGSDQNISVSLTAVSRSVSILGVNASQVTDFQVTSTPDADTNIIDGVITGTADVAELTYTGLSVGGGSVVSDATFTLTGSLGSVEITVTAFEKLRDVRNRINDETASTGVTASVSGSQLILQSTEKGSDETVSVSVSSGAFVVLGGNGTGTANGTDATALINGQLLTADVNDFTYSDGDGSYTFTVNDGFTGTIDTITVNASDDPFVISGGNGDSTADGTDATATINGQALTGTGNSFQLTSGLNDYSITFESGFTGSFDDITAISTPTAFDVTGGDENLSDTGTDVQATVNGQSISGTGNTINVTGESGTYTLTFMEDFSGAFDAISFNSVLSGELVVSGNSGFGSANGENALALINGIGLIGKGNDFTLQTELLELNFSITDGFSGEIDSFKISSEKGLLRVDDPLSDTFAGSDLDSLINPLVQLASGGELAGLASSADDVVEVIDTALEKVTELETEFQQSNESESESETDNTTPIITSEIISSSLKSLAEQNSDPLLSLLEPSIYVDLNSRYNVLTLLK